MTNYLKMIALAGTICALLVSCGRHEHATTKTRTPVREEWIIHSKIAVQKGHLAAGEFRLIAPFVAGNLYGNPTSSSYLTAKVNDDLTFELDLNPGHDAMVSELRETKLWSRQVKIVPLDARLANFSPAIVDRHTKSLGITNWVDGQTGRVLRLIYFDRPARITGPDFDIAVAEAGYVWVEFPSYPETAHVVPQPDELVLAFFGN
jgi:hypothetical protein